MTVISDHAISKQSLYMEVHVSETFLQLFQISPFIFMTRIRLILETCPTIYFLDPMTSLLQNIALHQSSVN